jgi:hypothetical protein
MMPSRIHRRGARRATWASQGVLAALFLTTGGAKLALPRSRLAEHAPWAGGASDAQVKLIGALEVAGAFGVLAPSLLGIGESLTPLAAGGLAATMVGAAVTNVRTDEVRILPVNGAIFALACFVAIERRDHS